MLCGPIRRPRSGSAGWTCTACPNRWQRSSIICVVYRPHTERQSHYVQTALSRQFDTVLHYDITRAVEPLESAAVAVTDELPETYPTAL